jgi:DNA-binding transcriptional regulator YiaG
MSFENMFNMSKDLILEVPDADFIKAFRESLNISQPEAAKIAGLNDRAIWNKYERGERTPSKHTWTLFVLMAGQHPRFKIDNV